MQYGAGMSPRGPRTRAVPPGDDRERLLCPDCGFVVYENPRIVVAVVATHEDQILLCRRAIAPREGFWNLPAGYLELGETPEQGALREAEEEAEVALELTGLLAVYGLSAIGQVQLVYRARFTEPSFGAGPESAEVALFEPEELPWSELAFPTHRWALERYLEVGTSHPLVPAANPPGASYALPPEGRSP